jgi:hypothetical protein
MRREVLAFECSKEDQLAWLVLRVIAALSPCTETSLIAYVAAGLSKSEVGLTTFTPYTREFISNSLLKLEGIAYIRFAQDQIAITEEGRRFLDELPVVAFGLDGRSANWNKSWGDTFEEINSALQAPPWTRYIALLREFATTLLAKIPRLKRFCQDRLALTGAVTPQGFLMNGARARDIALEVCKGKVAPIFESRATTLVLIVTRLAKVCRKHAEAAANILLKWRTLNGALLWKNLKASCLSLSDKLAGLSRLVIFAGVVLLVVLSTAGGVAFLSSKSSESEPIESSRESPIVWFQDGQDQQSIFVKRKFSGANRIEGISIRGENTSNQPLTAVQAALLSDTGEEIELAVSAARSQKTEADAHGVPSGSEFTLEYRFHLDASPQQTGMSAEEFLAKYGGMIFRFRYTMPGVQRTLIEYFSPSRLKAQLADAESAELSHSWLCCPAT